MLLAALPHLNARAAAGRRAEPGHPCSGWTLPGTVLHPGFTEQPIHMISWGIETDSGRGMKISEGLTGAGLAAAERYT